MVPTKRQLLFLIFICVYGKSHKNNVVGVDEGGTEAGPRLWRGRFFWLRPLSGRRGVRKVTFLLSVRTAAAPPCGVERVAAKPARVRVSSAQPLEDRPTNQLQGTQMLMLLCQALLCVCVCVQEQTTLPVHTVHTPTHTLYFLRSTSFTGLGLSCLDVAVASFGLSGTVPASPPPPNPNGLTVLRFRGSGFPPRKPPLNVLKSPLSTFLLQFIKFCL